MTGFGKRVESFGRRGPDPAAEASVPADASAVGTMFVDIKISPGSLARIQEELARAVCAAVEAGFARAGAMNQTEPV